MSVNSTALRLVVKLIIEGKNINSTNIFKMLQDNKTVKPEKKETLFIL